MYNGILNVYKEKGYTSFDVIAKLRGILHQKKIGHTGTLDPDAEGVLPVCLGKATKVCDLLTDKDKEYEAVLLLGIKTDTQDISGRVLCESMVLADETAVTAAIKSFEGEYMQIPPMYSACKVNGRKLCDLAREGVTIERQPRPVTIYSIEITEMKLPRVRMRVHCSKGTYIRTLCHDIGNALGCGGCLESLVRTRVADFQIRDAVRLSEICPDNVNRIIKEVDSLFLQYPQAKANVNSYKLLVNGNKIPEREVLIGEKPEDNEMIRLYDANNVFVGLYSYQQITKEYKPVKIFWDSTEG